MVTRELSKRIRAIVGESGKPYPIVIIDGDAPPALKGESFHWTTRGGKRVYHPSAYSRKGWSNLVYQHSTLRIEVGSEFVDYLKGVK